MKKIENTALKMIAEASRCPDYGPDMVKSLMKKLDMNEKGFALLMNVAPSTVRLWTSGSCRSNEANDAPAREGTPGLICLTHD